MKNSETGSTLQTSDFVDEKFEIIPEKTYVPPKAEPGKPEPGKPVISIELLTDEQVLNFLKGVLTLPHVFLSKIPTRTDEQLMPFCHELNLYCTKKGIDIRTYIFDEFGLIVTGCALGYGYVEDYRKFYKGKKEQTKEEKHLDADYDHAKEVEEKNKQTEEKKEGLKDDI